MQPWRCIYGTPTFVEWLDETLPTLRSSVVGGDITPEEQVDAIFNDYISGIPLNNDRRFKKLSSTPDHYVWELKTLDLRLFGWVPQRDHLILAYGELKDQLELLEGYGRFIAQTVFVRNNLDLDEPKHLVTREYDDVISDAPE